MTTQLSDNFFENLIKGAEFLHIRPEDILVVLTGETAGTLDPASTKWARPSREPTSWADANQLLQSENKPGALGLNTMQPGAAQTIGMTPKEWYHLPDMKPEENIGYSIRFWEAMRKARMPNSNYANALELYLSNAAPAMLGSRLAKNTVVYNSTLTKSNPALDINKDGVITVGDMAAVVTGIATGHIPPSALPNPSANSTWYLNAVNFINQYYDYLKRNNIDVPGTYSPVNYESNPDYDPGSIDEQIDNINKNHKDAGIYKGMPEKESSNTGLFGKLALTGFAGYIIYRLFKR